MTRSASCRALVAVALVAASLVACGDDLDSADTDAGLADVGVGTDAGGADATLDTDGPDADVDADTGVDTGADATPDVVEDVTPDVEPDVGPMIDWCDGATAHLWDPLGSPDLEFFPDGLYMREDETSPTGWRLDYSLETPWIANAPPLLLDSLAAMYDLSGFGTLGGVMIRFTEPVTGVPSGEAASTTDPGWRWMRIDGETPEPVPFDAAIFEDGLTVVLWPQVPLELDAEYAFVVTRDAMADDGGCIAPSDTTRALLAGTSDDERLQQFGPTYRAALETLEIDIADVSMLSVYRTHNDIGPVVRAAADVVTRPVEWGEWQGCEPYRDFLQCETSTTVVDYRDERGLVDDTRDPVEASIPVRVWLPEGEGPWPVVVYGHGLNSRRREGELIAERVTADGFVVVAMEAVAHGEHPSADPDDDLPALRFLGMDLDAFVIDALAIRGNFNQTNLDRLRLIELLRQSPDLDGDGIDEVQTDRITYLGASLGAMCGAGLLALSPDLDAGILTIGGARLLSVVTESDLLGDYEDIINFVIGSEVLFDRIVPVAQHIVDPADPGLWAAHVLKDRFDDRTPPSVLVNVGMADEVVPPGSGFALARALGAPHLGPVVAPVDTIETVEGPVEGNLADGTRTAAYFQMDRVSRGDAPPRAATHIETAKSDETAEMIRAFLEPWRDGEVPVILDPYPIVETPPLPEE